MKVLLWYSMILPKNQKNIQKLWNQVNAWNWKIKIKWWIKSKNLEVSNKQKSLNEVKSDNANSKNKMNLRNSSLDIIQKQLSIANKSILDLQNELNNLE